MIVISAMPWWERERLLTVKDKEEIAKAKDQDWGEIDEERAESEAGKYELHSIKMRKYHREEYEAGML